jgi:hypothetical protein
MSSLAPVHCREITLSDIKRIIDLLTKGFTPARKREDWAHAMRTLVEHPTPSGVPRYGYLLECGGVPVGVLLLIFSSLIVGGAPRLRCNVSSWYVEPEFRGYAALLASYAVRYRDVTYSNISASPHTWPILQAQGYTRFSSGLYAAIPALRLSSPPCRIDPVGSMNRRETDLQSFEIDLLLSHARYGCISLICRSGRSWHPFIFRRRLMLGFLPVAHLIYCRDLTDFVRFAGPLGRYLLRRGIPLIDIDSNGPIEGLIGRYRAGRAKFSKGPEGTRLGDLAYSEFAMFGF